MEKKTHTTIKSSSKGTVSELDPETAYSLGKKRREMEMAYLVIEKLFKLNVCSKYNKEIKRRYNTTASERIKHEKESTSTRKLINQQLQTVLHNIKIHQDQNQNGHKKLGRPKKKVDFELVD